MGSSHICVCQTLYGFIKFRGGRTIAVHEFNLSTLQHILQAVYIFSYSQVLINEAGYHPRPALDNKTRLDSDDVLCFLIINEPVVIPPKASGVVALLYCDKLEPSPISTDSYWKDGEPSFGSCITSYAAASSHRFHP